MFPGTKVVAVDDDREELSRIVGTLRDLGIGCISYNYPNERPEPSISSGVRVIFMDINLVGGNSPENDPQVFAAPISLIGRIISESNGPYALVTWSDTDLHENLVQRIAQTPELARKQPFHTRCLPKGGFVGNAEGLAAEVRSTFGETPPFGALLDWERRVAAASDTVLADVYEHSKRFPNGNPSEKMDLMLSCLAVKSFNEHADSHRFEAVSDALFPILGDALNSQFWETGNKDVWDAAVSRCDNIEALDTEIQALLNASVSIEIRDSIKPYRRGAILRVPESWDFNYRFGANAEELARKIQNVPDVSQLEWVLVQIQAACDFNQAKPAPIPYFLGAIVPADTLKGARARPNSIYATPQFPANEGISEVPYNLCVFHGTPYPLTLRAISRNSLQVVGRLKDQLVEDISHEHHKHASRPGTLSF